MEQYSRIFISNPDNQILFRNNYALVKHYASVCTFRHAPDQFFFHWHVLEYFCWGISVICFKATLKLAILYLLVYVFIHFKNIDQWFLRFYMWVIFSIISKKFCLWPKKHLTRCSWQPLLFLVVWFNCSHIWSRDRPIWLFWGQYRYIGHTWADSQYPIFPKILNLVFCFIIKNMMYFMPYLCFKNLKNQDLWAKIFFQYFINLLA